MTMDAAVAVAGAFLEKSIDCDDASQRDDDQRGQKDARGRCGGEERGRDEKPADAAPKQEALASDVAGKQHERDGGREEQHAQRLVDEASVEDVAAERLDERPRVPVSRNGRRVSTEEGANGFPASSRLRT